MRAPLLSLFLILPLAAASTACQDGRGGGEGPDLVQIAEGHLERVDPSDPDSPWVGYEELRLEDGEGGILCEGEIDLDAESHGLCDGCEVTLDVRRQVIRDLAESCQDLDDVEQVQVRRYIAFVPSEMKGMALGHGSVMHADAPEGPWTLLATGVSDGETLVYQRRQDADGAWVPTARTDLRPLREQQLGARQDHRK